MFASSFSDISVFIQPYANRCTFCLCVFKNKHGIYLDRLLWNLVLSLKIYYGHLVQQVGIILFIPISICRLHNMHMYNPLLLSIYSTTNIHSSHFIFRNWLLWLLNLTSLTSWTGWQAGHAEKSWSQCGGRVPSSLGYLRLFSQGLQLIEWSPFTL